MIMGPLLELCCNQHMDEMHKDLEELHKNEKQKGFFLQKLHFGNHGNLLTKCSLYYFDEVQDRVCIWHSFLGRCLDRRASLSC